MRVLAHEFGDAAEQQPAPALHQHAEHVLAGLRQGAERGGHHQHAAVADQAQPHQFAGGQGQQRWRRVRLAGGNARVAAPAHQRFQRQRLVQPQHAHLRFRLGPAGRFQPHLGDPEHPVQQRLVQVDVVDACERDLAQAAVQPATADADAIAAQQVAIGEVLGQRGHHQPGHRQQAPQVVAVAAAGEQQHQQRQDELLELREQHEQPGQRMQPVFLPVPWQCGGVRGGLAHRVTARRRRRRAGAPVHRAGAARRLRRARAR